MLLSSSSLLYNDFTFARRLHREAGFHISSAWLWPCLSKHVFFVFIFHTGHPRYGNSLLFVSGGNKVLSTNSLMCRRCSLICSLWWCECFIDVKKINIRKIQKNIKRSLRNRSPPAGHFRLNKKIIEGYRVCFFNGIITFKAYFCWPKPNSSLKL